MVGLPALFNLRQWQTDRRLALQLRSELQGYIPGDYPPNSPKVSFLVAAWNERGMIQRCIQSVLGLPYPDLELVLCAGGSDGTYELARQASLDPRLTLLEQQPGEGKQRALQRCLQASRGEIIYLIDADCLIDRRAFELCLRPLLEGREEVVTGSFYHPLLEQQQNSFALIQAASYAYRSACQPDESQGILGGNCSLVRQALLVSGEFLNPVSSGTDYDLAIRLRTAGKRIRFERQAYIYSRLQIRVSSYLRQQRRWLRNLIRHGRRVGDYNLVVNSLKSSLLGLALLLSPLLALFLVTQAGLAAQLGKGVFFAWSFLFLHGLFSRLRYQAFARIWPGFEFPKKSALLIPVFMLVDFVAWATPLPEYIFQSRGEGW